MSILMKVRGKKRLMANDVESVVNDCSFGRVLERTRYKDRVNGSSGESKVEGESGSESADESERRHWRGLVRGG